MCPYFCKVSRSRSQFAFSRSTPTPILRCVPCFFLPLLRLHGFKVSFHDKELEDVGLSEMLIRGWGEQTRGKSNKNQEIEFRNGSSVFACVQESQLSAEDAFFLSLLKMQE